MVNINSENFFINLWNTFPHPSFVISKNFRIINLNSAVENLFITSKKKLQEKKIYDFFESPTFNSEYYELLCDNFRSPHIWEWNINEEKWVLREKLLENNENGDFISWEGNN